MKRKPRHARKTLPSDRQNARGALRKPKSIIFTEAPRSYLVLLGFLIVSISIGIIYWQTVSVSPIDYEDSYYLVHSPYVHAPVSFSRLSAVWREPYFANFHPVTTTSWLLDRAFANRNAYFDAVPFRIAHLFYAAVGASLLIVLYQRLGVPRFLAIIGAVLYAVHPVHTEVVAWLSARKDLISFLFIALALLAWLYAREASNVSEWRLRYSIVILLVLLAVLSKPVAVIVPVFFIAFEFCARPHGSIRQLRWANRGLHPQLTRVFALSAVFVIIGAISTWIFRILLQKDATNGGWLIPPLIGLLLLMLVAAPPRQSLADFRTTETSGLRVIVPAMIVLSAVSGAGSAWTLWAQGQVGAIKGGLTLLPTVNLTFDTMTAYARKTLIPTGMSASYHWNSYPNVSIRGILGLMLLVALLWLATRFSGSADHRRRLIAFGIFWWLIALIPVSNLVPTSTKMADRYLFVPTAGAILALIAAVAVYFPSSRAAQWISGTIFAMIIVCFGIWSYRRTEVWCGKTTLWEGRQQPDLSLWTAAVETDPDNSFALTSLGLAYLRLDPPEPEVALVHLNRALRLDEANQSKIAGNKQLILTPVYDALGDGYLAKANHLAANVVDAASWREKKDAYISAAKYYGLACLEPSGFASADARVCASFGEALANQAQMETQEIYSDSTERLPLTSHRDYLRQESMVAVLRAREILAAASVPSIDPNFRTVMLEEGNIVFGREVGEPNDEKKAAYYRKALESYQDAAGIIPDDPRPYLYEGLCYERLTGIAETLEQKQHWFTLANAALHHALTLNTDSSDYSPAMPYRALASLYAHMADYRSVLDSLRAARLADPSTSESSGLDAQIKSVEKYLATP